MKHQLDVKVEISIESTECGWWTDDQCDKCHHFIATNPVHFPHQISFKSFVWLYNDHHQTIYDNWWTLTAKKSVIHHAHSDLHFNEIIISDGGKQQQWQQHYTITMFVGHVLCFCHVYAWSSVCIMLFFAALPKNLHHWYIMNQTDTIFWDFQMQKSGERETQKERQRKK